ncbi:MAG: SAM-dependent DNA methyltransferase [Bacteroidetes bacterium]|nr:SAM-dependent DNA methyltransferase [Bacteroidota bacterium]
MSRITQIENYNRKFGAVFTPLSWAKRIVEKHFFNQWLEGATILDPTAGEGVFIEAFLCIAKEKSIKLTNENLSRLFGIELNQKFIDNFFQRVNSVYFIEFPKSNYRQGDILFQANEIKADFLVGNPPWVNFTDLDDDYKEKIKHLFLEFGLVANQKDLLLGNARTDIASLILLKVLHSNLKENGKAIFFLPLSIFQNDGANQQFRNYKVKGIEFCVEDIIDFNGNKIFEDILGRYGVALFHRNIKQKFPIKYHVLENGKWHSRKAKPLFSSTDPLTVFDNEETESRLDGFQKIVLARHFQPRQGVNTCGANDIFFFGSFKLVGQNRVELKSKSGETVIVDSNYVYPLTVSSTLTSETPQPEKVILIPHQQNGKPIDLETLQQEEGLFSYLLKHKTLLENRKGVLINTWINKGYWWALMGIGVYSFVPYKIMWKAFGDSVFKPKILKPDKNFGSWQGNQSLNAFIGASTLDEANEIYNKLTNPIIQDYLASLRMQGTCNWAQPGRMKKLMEFV